MKAFSIIYLKIRDIKNGIGLKTYSSLRLMFKGQFWDRKKMEEYQVLAMNSILQKSKLAKYYADRALTYDCFIDRPERFKELPSITKSDYQSNYTEFMTGDKNNGTVHVSSGSTGQPTKIFISKSAELYRKASRMRYLNWWGLKPSDRYIYYSVYPKNRKGMMGYLMRTIDPKLTIDIFQINEQNIKNIYLKIMEFQPKYIRGYPSVIYSMASLIKELQLKMEKVKLKVIMLTGEILYSYQRQFIEDVFKCPVSNEYGSSEAGLIAYECQKGGMHVQEESVYIFNNSKNEIISTELYNDLTPLINYKIGDKAIFSQNECSCGRKLKLLEIIEGRISSDDIIKPNGEKLNYLFFNNMITNLNETDLWGKIKRFQVIQKGKIFDCHIVKNDQYDERVTAHIVSYLKNGISKDIEVNVLFLDEIIPDKSGKIRIFKNAGV